MIRTSLTKASIALLLFCFALDTGPAQNLEEKIGSSKDLIPPGSSESQHLFATEYATLYPKPLHSYHLSKD